ncbi:uncharacterized protein B0T15DRAFT_525015 [Chaetomium strumarium]|uniref:ubiquitinyl hydrolase 1 n=1 Tax=Chaetomium strumarium TaxID=1170767 RepID=A0AAJ0GYW9_9PEZI|nr:hypothetical protein B0T15DRAFT_525015 [Chaetomium strumarium]
MNSDTRRIPSQFDTSHGSDFYDYYVAEQPKSRFISLTAFVTIFSLAATVLCSAAVQQGWLISLSHLLWEALVFIIPARLLFAVDRSINPSLIPLHMYRSQQRTRAAKSDALQRILGLNSSGGIRNSVSQVGRKGSNRLFSSALDSRAAGDRPPGLGNYDNSCFQNSILQGLASLKPLLEYLSAISLERRLDLSPTRTVDTLRELIAELSSPSSNGRTLWTPGVLKNMSTWQQQDAHEYYSKLLDQIDNEIAKATRALHDSPGLEPDVGGRGSPSSHHSNDSGYHSLAGHSKGGVEPRLIRNPLEGFMAQRVACVNCGYCEGLSMIPFNCLTLTLGNLPEHDLYERLNHYTKVEAIQGVECPKCTLLVCRDAVKTLAERTGDIPEIRQRLQVLEEALQEEAFDDETLRDKCKVTAKARITSTKTKQVALARPPQSLVFHVNRSGFDEATGYMFKNSAAVRFPMMLDLGPWCLGSSGGVAGVREDKTAAQDVERWTLDPRASMVAGDGRPSRITGPIYELRAVVTHYGHHENGHYVCYRRHPVSSASNASRVEGAERESPVNTTPEEDAVGDAMGSDHEPQSAPNTNGSLLNQGDRLSQWWRLSDDDVTEVDEKTVLSQGGVFMLFYDCVDPNSVLVSEPEKPVRAESACQGIMNLDESPTHLPAAQGLGMVQDRDWDSTTDSGETLQLDEVLPFSGTPTVPGTSPIIAMADERFSDITGIASERQLSSLDSEATPERSTTAIWNHNSEQDQETISMCSDTTVVGDDEFPLPRYYQMCAT